MSKCKLCNNASLKAAYTPAGSEINLSIHICKFCGFVQGTYDVETYESINDAVHNEASIVTRLNCDAAYSDIRVGKQQMLSNAVELLERNSIKNNIKKVLDMRAARGDFVNYINKLYPNLEIDAIETDQYMAKQIQNAQNINVIPKKYKDWNPIHRYDLIYSCHTLEHYRDPKTNLKYIYEYLSEDGYVILDVPNFDIISKTANFDEYFYDKHLSYFNKDTLIKMMMYVGFENVDLNSDGACLYGLFRKSNRKEVPKIDLASVEHSLNTINNYKDDIQKNRSELHCICASINKFVTENPGGICFFGIGRMYDAFRTYGNLDMPNNVLLIDNYLSKATGELYGKTIYDQQAISSEIKNIILFTRSNSVKKELSKLYADVGIYHWSEFKLGK